MSYISFLPPVPRYHHPSPPMLPPPSGDRATTATATVDDWSLNLTFEEAQRRRQDLLKSVCAKYGRKVSRPILSERFLISHKNHLLYCCNAKVGTTTWKVSTFFKVAKYQNHVLPPFAIMDKYTSFLTVRHPFERLVSAYEHKVLRNHAKYLHNSTFIEFLNNFVIKEAKECPGNHQCMNIHWMPYISSCGYCNFPYTYIQKMETFDRDAEKILQKVNLGYLWQKHHQNNDRKTNITAEALTKSYFDNLSNDIKETLFNIYRYDFESFDYHLKY